MIPAANVKNLMLKKCVVDAVRQGQFKIWQVATIEEGINILTVKPPASPIPRATSRRIRSMAR